MTAKALLMFLMLPLASQKSSSRKRTAVCGAVLGEPPRELPLLEGREPRAESLNGSLPALRWPPDLSAGREGGSFSDALCAPLGPVPLAKGGFTASEALPSAHRQR